MDNLTFGEQVKIMLGRKGMTIKELAETIEDQTGKKMSRQNLTQRLGRDNFQEQDMRLIATILGCPFTLNILTHEPATESTEAVEGVVSGFNIAGRIKKSVEAKQQKVTDSSSERADTQENTEQKVGTTTRRLIVAGSKSDLDEAIQEEKTPEVDMTIGDMVELHRDLDHLEQSAQTGEMPVHEIKEELDKPLIRVHNDKLEKWKSGFKPNTTATEDEEEDLTLGELNPYTGREYQTNSVRMHPSRIGYVQVYDRAIHKWTDMTEWAFLGYQERKKNLLGRNYEPPIYLD